MKKLNLTEVKVLARQIANNIVERRDAEFEKAIKNPKFGKALVKLANTHPVVKLYKSASTTEQDVLLKCMYRSATFKCVLEGKIEIPKQERIDRISYYSIYTDGCVDQLQEELLNILDQFKIPRVTDDLKGLSKVDEQSTAFRSIMDKIIIEQIDCKDIQSLIKRVTNYFI